MAFIGSRDPIRAFSLAESQVTWPHLCAPIGGELSVPGNLLSACFEAKRWFSYSSPFLRGVSCYQVGWKSTLHNSLEIKFISSSYIFEALFHSITSSTSPLATFSLLGEHETSFVKMFYCLLNNSVNTFTQFLNDIRNN